MPRLHPCPRRHPCPGRHPYPIPIQSPSHPTPTRGPGVQPRGPGRERVFIPPVYELQVGILGVTHRLQPRVNHNCNFPVCLGKRGEGSVKREEELENVRKRQQRL